MSDLINRIIESEKRSGLLKTEEQVAKRVLALKKMSEERLSALLSDPNSTPKNTPLATPLNPKNSTNIPLMLNPNPAQNNSVFATTFLQEPLFGLELTNKKQPGEEEKITLSTPVKTDSTEAKTTEFLSIRAKSAQGSFDNQMKEDGWAGDVADYASVLWGSKNRAKFVREDLSKFNSQIKQLQTAQSKGTSEYKSRFKEVFGVEYDSKNIEAFEGKEQQNQLAMAVYGIENNFNSTNDKLLKTPKLKEEMGSVYAGPYSAPQAYVATTKEEIYNREMKNFAQFIGQGDVAEGKTQIEEYMKSTGMDLSKATLEQKYEVMQKRAVEYSKELHQNVMTVTENKGMEAFTKEYDASYKKAFGDKNDIAKRVTNYNNSQQAGAMIVKSGVILVGSIGAGVLTGGAGLALFPSLVAMGASTAAVTATVEVTNELTKGSVTQDVRDGYKKDGIIGGFKGFAKGAGTVLTKEKIEEILKSAGINGAAAFAGGLAATGIEIGGQAINLGKGLKAVSFVAADIGVGAGAEYVQTGTVTIQGVAFAAALSSTGQIFALAKLAQQAVKGAKSTENTAILSDGAKENIIPDLKEAEIVANPFGKKAQSQVGEAKLTESTVKRDAQTAVTKESSVKANPKAEPKKGLVTLTNKTTKAETKATMSEANAKNYEKPLAEPTAKADIEEAVPLKNIFSADGEDKISAVKAQEVPIKPEEPLLTPEIEVEIPKIATQEELRTYLNDLVVNKNRDINHYDLDEIVELADSPEKINCVAKISTNESFDGFSMSKFMSLLDTPEKAVEFGDLALNFSKNKNIDGYSIARVLEAADTPEKMAGVKIMSNSQKLHGHQMENILKFVDAPKKGEAIGKLVLGLEKNENVNSYDIASIVEEANTLDKINFASAISTSKKLNHHQIEELLPLVDTPEKVNPLSDFVLAFDKNEIIDGSGLTSIVNAADTPEKMVCALKLSSSESFDASDVRKIMKLVDTPEKGEAVGDLALNLQKLDGQYGFNMFKTLELASTNDKILLANTMINNERCTVEDLKYALENVKMKTPTQVEIFDYLYSKKEADGDYALPSIKDVTKVANRFQSFTKDEFSECVKLIDDDQGFSSDEQMAIVRAKSKPIQNSAEFDEAFKPFIDKFKESDFNENQMIVLKDKLVNLFTLATDESGELMIKDPKIEEHFSILLATLVTEKMNFQETKGVLDAATKLVEIEHSSQNLSSTLTGNSYEYLQNRLDDESTSKDYKDRIKDIGKIYDAKDNAYDVNPYRESVLLKNETETDALKSFLANYHDCDAEFSTHLYENYYLNRLAPEPRAICKKISDEFGTKLFVEDEASPHASQLVYEEFQEWQKASNGQFKKPPSIDLSKHSNYYVENPGIRGVMYNANERVALKGEQPSSIKFAVRHELTHVNDSSPDDYSGVINGVDFDKINPKDENGELIFDKCLHKEEFENAGISPKHIEYAYEDKCEFIAVAAQGDCSKYSPEFKKLLIDLGLPEYVLNMTPKDNMIQVNSSFKSKLAEKIDLNKDEKFDIGFYSDKICEKTKQLSQQIVQKFEKTFGSIDGVKTQARTKESVQMQEKVYRYIKKAQDKIEVLEKKLKNSEISEADRADIEQEIYDNKELMNSLKTNMSAVQNAIGDALGQRIIMDNPTPENIEKIVKQIVEDIENGEYVITNLENYATSKDGFYFNQDQVDRIVGACDKQGIKTNYSGGSKDSGYTTTQLNIVYKNGVRSEMQVRGKDIHALSENEHLMYDIREGKDLSKGNEEIKSLIKPLRKALKALNEDSEAQKAYNGYVKSCYAHQRALEMGKVSTKPTLPENLPKVLDLDYVSGINQKLSTIKDK